MVEADCSRFVSCFKNVFKFLVLVIKRGGRLSIDQRVLKTFAAFFSPRYKFRSFFPPFLFTPPPLEFCTQPKPNLNPYHHIRGFRFVSSFPPRRRPSTNHPFIPYTCLLSLYKWVLETPRSRHVGVFVPRSRTKRWLTFHLHRTMAEKDLPPVFLVPPIVFLRPPCHNLSVPAVSHRETAIETVVLHHPTPTNCPIRIGISWQTY